MTVETLRRLARRELAPREIAEAVRHVRECRACAGLAEEELGAGIDAVGRVLASERVSDSAHPDYDDLAAYVDGRLGPVDREIIDAHLDDCPTCRTDVADLRAVQTSAPSRGARRRRPWRTAITVAAAALIAAVIILQRSDDAPPRPSDPRPRPPVATTTTIPPTTTTPTTTAPPPVPPHRYANADWERLVATAIATATLPFPPALPSAPDTLRGSGENGEQRVAPAGVVIDETRPRFTWPARAGATYVVSIFSGDDEVTRSEPLTSPGWTPPAALPRGRTYLWQVEATRGDGTREILPAPPDPPATFRIIARREHDELAAARKRHPDDHVLHAVLAARAGLREEALDALQRVDREGDAARLVSKYR